MYPSLVFVEKEAENTQCTASEIHPLRTSAYVLAKDRNHSLQQGAPIRAGRASKGKQLWAQALSGRGTLFLNCIKREQLPDVEYVPLVEVSGHSVDGK